MIELLKRGLEYDLWANKQWLECLTRTGADETDWSIFQHIQGAKLAWLLRCEGNPPAEPPKPALDVATLEDIFNRWIHVLERMDLEQWIDYKRFNGEPMRMQLSWMVHHVINHGTYHRGELRGLRRARGDEDFPDTDIAVYAFLAGGGETL